MQFYPFHKLISATMDHRQTAAARALLAASAARHTVDQLQALFAAGLITEDQAAQLALELIDQATHEVQAGDEEQPPRLAAPAAEPENDGDHANARRFASGDPENDNDPTGAQPPAPKPRRRRRTATAGQPLPPKHCPVCGVEIGPAAVACRLHWRQVKGGHTTNGHTTNIV